MQDSVQALRACLREAPPLLHDSASSQRVTLLWHRLLCSNEAQAGTLAVEMLHGQHGVATATSTWKAISTGMRLDGAEAFKVLSALRYSMAAYCIMRGTISILDAIVQAGPPPVMRTSLRPKDLSGWMDLLSSTEAERSALRVDLMVSPMMVPTGAVGAVASLAHAFPDAAGVALDLVWRTSPQHPGFGAMTEDATDSGAFVREFLMRKHMEEASHSNAVTDLAATAPRLRRDRL